MSAETTVRWGWLKVMYVYTIIGAGGCGLGLIFFPGVMKSALGFPAQDPITLGVLASVYIAFGIVSIPALRSPLKFAPILLLQLCYKVIWLIVVVLPLVILGELPSYAIPVAVIFVTYIIGDLIAIPFRYVFAGERDQQAA